MNPFAKTVAAILLAAAANLAVLDRAAAQDDVIVAVTDNSPNFSEPGPDGAQVGINIDIARHLCERMGIRCTLTPMPLSRLKDDIAADRAQLGFGNLIKTPERERTMLFSEPYWRSSTAFVGPAGATAKSHMALVENKRVAVQAGSRQEKWLIAAFGGAISIVSEPGIGDVLESLSSGRADLALAPMMTVYPFLTSPHGQSFGFVGDPMDSGHPVHVVVSQARPELLERLNQALEESRRDGSLRRIVRAYVPFDIF